MFLDDNALLIDDPDHSVHEARFLLLGISSHLRALVVCHCCRDRDNVIRIISARKSRSIRAGPLLEGTEAMKKHYDFSKARKNPYAKRLKKQVTIRLDEPTLAYFKDLGERVGMPYQTLINMYLRDCAEARKELRLLWRSTDAA